MCRAIRLLNVSTSSTIIYFLYLFFSLKNNYGDFLQFGNIIATLQTKQISLNAVETMEQCATFYQGRDIISHIFYDNKMNIEIYCC